MAPLYFMVGGVLFVVVAMVGLFTFLDWRERHKRT